MIDDKKIEETANKHMIWIAIRAINTCTENGFIVED